jgi:hypothetical protein
VFRMDLRIAGDYFPIHHCMWLFIMEIGCVYCLVRTGFSNLIQVALRFKSFKAESQVSENKYEFCV